jgi:hypothetical protein
VTIFDDQKEFIRNKVAELKTIEAVEKLYKTDSPVDIWANTLARKTFKTLPALKRRKGK